MRGNIIALIALIALIPTSIVLLLSHVGDVATVASFTCISIDTSTDAQESGSGIETSSCWVC